MDLEKVIQDLLNDPHAVWNYVTFLDNAVNNKKVIGSQPSDRIVHQIIVQSELFVFSLTFDSTGDCNYRLFLSECDYEAVLYYTKINHQFRLHSRIHGIESLEALPRGTIFKLEFEEVSTVPLIESMHLIV